MSTSTVPTSHTRGHRSLSAVFLLAVGAGGIYAGMRWHTTFERWLVPESARLTPGDATSTHDRGGEAIAAAKELWTCGMHPQVIQDHPGDCPICHMKLTPLAAGSNGTDQRASSTPAGTVTIDPVIVQNMGVRLVTAVQGSLSRHVRATATVVEPDNARTDVNLRVSGWIERLHANTDGMEVRKGDPLFDLFSPELRLAIDEFIAARRAIGTPTATESGEVGSATVSLAAAAESRLKTLGLTSEQVENLGAMDHAPATVAVVSPIDGVVIDKANVYQGSGVMAGQLVLRLADRSTMWIEARLPEQSFRRIARGQHATIHVDAIGPRPLAGEVVFVHPNLDEMTRTALVRVAVPNSDGRLRVGMYASVEIDSGDVAAAVLLPREAIIHTGEAQMVFVSTGKGRFEPRRVVLGETGDDGMVQIISGIAAGESVVASGQFLIDSESRLREAIAKFLVQSDAKPVPSTSGALPSSKEANQTSVTTAPIVRNAKAPASLVDRVIAEYLSIAEAFGEEKPGTPPAAVDSLLASIDALAATAEGSDASSLISAARDAALSMRSQPIEKQREVFKRVSAAIIAIVDAMPPSDSVAASLFIANCPMAKADWLQHTETLANPYYAEDMKECGSIVRRVGDRQAPGGPR